MTKQISASPEAVKEFNEPVVPFKVAIPQSAVEDLRRRLSQVRWPERETVEDWSQGVPLSTAQTLVQYWLDGYDWRKFEVRINAYPQFRTNIYGLGIHFIHVKSPHPNALPLILTHGWPGSVVEFLKVIDRLTDPTAFGGKAEDAFHVVIPSLPGFGFSEKPASTGWDFGRTAMAWTVLMQRLGYSEWVAQGTDLGSGICHVLGHMRPQGLLAAHVTMPFVFPAKFPEIPTAEETVAIDAALKNIRDGFGYHKMQSTRPQTIGYALADSPVAQALWIYEKFQAWTDITDDVTEVLTLDELLDNISVYWFTNSGASSARFYWETNDEVPPSNSIGFSAGRFDLPISATVFPKEIYRTPKAWAEEMWPGLFYWNEVDKGGHFAAFEQPALFVEELQKAFTVIRRH